MKNAARKITMTLALGVAACAAPTQNSKVWNVPGEDSNVALLPGQGFNPVDSTIKGNCVSLGKFATQSGNATGQTAEYRLLEITSEQGLRESLNVSAAASFTGAVGRANARASFAQSVNKNNQSRYLLVHVRVANQLEIASSFTFTDSAQRLLRSGDSTAFMRQCGSEFVYGRRTGGEFFAVFEFTFTSSDEDRAFSAAVSGSGISWKGSGSVNFELSKFGRFASTQVKMYKVGGTSGLPDVNSIADFAGKFDTLVANAHQGAITLELLTKGYEGTEPLDLRPNAELLVRQRYVMEQLALNRDVTRENLNTVRLVKANATRYVPFDAQALDLTESKLNTHLNLINDAAVECFADVLNGCRLPEAALPSVSIPSRRSEPICRDTQVPVCVVPDGNDGCLAFEFETKQVCQ
jgi:hypothetical protein